MRVFNSKRRNTYGEHKPPVRLALVHTAPRGHAAKDQKYMYIS